MYNSFIIKGKQKGRIEGKGNYCKDENDIKSSLRNV